jgi:hypothetical protein
VQGDYLWALGVAAGFPHPVFSDSGGDGERRNVHTPAAACRTTGSAHAASLFFTRFTRLLTSYRRINAGSNGFNRSHTLSGCSKRAESAACSCRVRQKHGEHTPLSFHTAKSNSPFMLLDNLGADPKTQPCANVFLGSKEGLKDSLPTGL